ncbi:MAG TPA: hypothetical protein VEL75_01445 [Candidatus Methylomirabilis sp.]|nr:hypothetical protein [Candidatus Methylomirabilis sp.]
MEESVAASYRVRESITLTALESARVRKYEEGFLAGETKARDKIAGKSKRRAHEVLIIDRSDPSVTIKCHEVQEFDGADQPVGEPHKHTNTSPAKRRPRRAQR